MDNKNLSPAIFNDQPAGAELGPLPMPGQSDQSPVEIIDLGAASSQPESAESTPKDRERRLGSAALNAKIEELKSAERQMLSGGESEAEFTDIVINNRDFNTAEPQSGQGSAK